MLFDPGGEGCEEVEEVHCQPILEGVKPIFLDQRPTVIGCPYDLWPIRDNTLMVDNNPFKNILNLTSNYIVCSMWTVGKVQDLFLIDLGRYVHVFVGSGLPIPQFLLPNRR